MSDIPSGHDELPQPLDRRAGDLEREDGTTIADRVGRDPSNLGDEVADEGDLTHPTPVPSESQI